MSDKMRSGRRHWKRPY